jgi:hypothetical protein
MKPVFKKLVDLIDSEERAKLKSYETIYNEDTGIFTGKSNQRQPKGRVFDGKTGGQEQSPQQLDKEIALQFLQQAGGDRNKARELAQQAGYIF